MFDDEYVLPKTHKCVAFVRVEPLMDRALLAASLRAMLRERNTRPRWDARYGAQWSGTITASVTPSTTASCSGRMSIRIGTADDDGDFRLGRFARSGR